VIITRINGADADVQLHGETGWCKKMTNSKRLMILGAGAFQAPAIREAAEYLYSQNPRGLVLFAGKHDDSFIFHLRRLDEKREHVVLRADKILVWMAVHQPFGVHSHVADQDEIRSMIERYGVEITVVEKPDIIELQEFYMLHRLLNEPGFELLASQLVSFGGNAKALVRIEIYRHLNYQPATEAEIVIPLPHMNREIRYRRGTVQ
jgi:hypothetical protein